MRSFKTFIKRYRGQDDPIGDLADDIKEDDNFPTTASYTKIRDYLEGKNACQECIDAFNGIYTVYWLESLKEEMERYDREEDD